MDVITHTILAVGSLAVAYYGGRWLLIREARSMFPRQTPKELIRQLKHMDSIIDRLASEDFKDVYAAPTKTYQTVTIEDVKRVKAKALARAEAHKKAPLQLELFPQED